MKTPIIGPDGPSFLSLVLFRSLTASAGAAMRNRSTRNLALLLAISAPLYGLDANAQEQEAVKPKSVADLVNEARRRVEGDDKLPYSDWQGSKREQQETKHVDEPKRRWGYWGIGFDINVSYSDRELYRLRETQQQRFPLEYLEPSDKPFKNHDPGGYSLFVGVELTNWLDLELASHGGSSFYQLHSTTPVSRTTMTPDDPRATDATQFNSFYEETYSLTLLPRWNIHRHVSLYGRLGVGYSNSRTDSSLTISAYVPGEPHCTTDPYTKVETCTPTTKLESRTLDDGTYRRNAFFPVAGAGIRLFRVIRIEYIYRANIPIGESTTDISGAFLSLSWPVGGI